MIALVQQLRLEADRVVSVRLTDPDGGPLPPWRPGAHVGVELPTGLTRQYSLCGSPEDRGGYRIGVLRERRSRGGSEYVHSFLRPGQKLRIGQPRNNFPLVDADRHLFIAGGIGITPILPMINQLGRKPWRLAYCGRSSSSLAFQDELSVHNGHIELFTDGNRLSLKKLLAEPRTDTAVYACGPESLLAGVEEAMRDWPAEALHVERFAARPKPARPNHEFEVVCARSDRTLTVPADRTVLDVLQDNGIPVEGSCREGICGTCQVRVLAGPPDHRDDILSEAEQQAGDRMFPCVSRCAGPRLTLDV
jgi:ferredoxin-NADP reductase